MAKAAKKAKQATNEIAFDGNVSLFLVIMLGIGCALIFASVLTIMEPQVPGYIKALMGLVVLSTTALILQGIRHTRGTKIVLGPSALEVSGPYGVQKYAWGKIEAVRVVGAVGCFADDPFNPIEKRLGLGLFLKGGAEGRMEASDADAILAVGSQDEGNQFVDAASLITKALRGRQRPGGKAPGKPQLNSRRPARAEFAQRHVA